jgi:hypothetical protein
LPVSPEEKAPAEDLGRLYDAVTGAVYRTGAIFVYETEGISYRHNGDGTTFLRRYTETTVYDFPRYQRADTVMDGD